MPANTQSCGSAVPRGKVAVIGAGGNIGSHLVTHLARMPEVSEILLVDPGTYEDKDLRTQDIEASDVGRQKVDVQAARVRRIRQDLAVTAIPRPVESVPWGMLRADTLLACLDSRRSRQVVNELAWTVDAPWIDAGVLADQMLARVSRYIPSPCASCMECAWSANDYSLIEQIYPCSDGAFETAPTNAPSALGALAAAFQAMACEKLLKAPRGACLESHELIVDAAYHKLYSTDLRRNPACLFEHAQYEARVVYADVNTLSIGELLDEHHRHASNSTDPHALKVAGQAFACELVCRNGCAEKAIVPSVVSRLHEGESRCTECGGPRFAPGFSVKSKLIIDANCFEWQSAPLRALGVQDRDLLVIEDGLGRRHLYEIASPICDFTIREQCPNSI